MNSASWNFRAVLLAAGLLGSTILAFAASGQDAAKSGAYAPAADRMKLGDAEADRRAVAELDTAYQRAVKNNDVATMSRILADDFVVVEGTGKVWTKADLIGSASDGKTRYEHQEDSEQTVRVWGNTAVVTAKLWAKGLEDGEQVDYTEWFSDTYVRTPNGWKYVFGQASLPLPKGTRP